MSSSSFFTGGLIARRGSSASSSSRHSSASLKSCNSRDQSVKGVPSNSDRKCRLYLLNSRKVEFAYKNDLVVQELFDIACCQAAISHPDRQYFSLFTYDEQRNRYWLDVKAKATSCVIDSSKRDFEIYLGIKFFVPNVTELQDFTTIELFYLECRKLIYEGSLVASWEQVCQLTALALQESNGNYISEEQTEISLSEESFVFFPSETTAELKRTCLRQISLWHQRLNGKTREECVYDYMHLVQTLPTYGLHLYPVKCKSVPPPGSGGGVTREAWLGIGVSGLQQWGRVTTEYAENHVQRLMSAAVMKQDASYDWRSITQMRQSGKDLTIEVENNASDRIEEELTADFANDGNSNWYETIDDESLYESLHDPSTFLSDLRSRRRTYHADQQNLTDSDSSRALTDSPVLNPSRSSGRLTQPELLAQGAHRMSSGASRKLFAGFNPGKNARMTGNHQRVRGGDFTDIGGSSAALPTSSSSTTNAASSTLSAASVTSQQQSSYLVTWSTVGGVKSELMKNVFKLAQEHHTFYLNWTFLDISHFSTDGNRNQVGNRHSAGEVSLASFNSHNHFHHHNHNPNARLFPLPSGLSSEMVAQNCPSVVSSPNHRDVSKSSHASSLQDVGWNPNGSGGVATAGLSASELSINSSTSGFSDSGYNMGGFNINKNPRFQHHSKPLASSLSVGSVRGRLNNGHPAGANVYRNSGGGASNYRYSGCTEGGATTDSGGSQGGDGGGGGEGSCSTSSRSFSMLSGTSDLGPSMETLQDLVVAFSAQRDTLLDRLRVKLDQLKEVCLQESEITGMVPREYPLTPGSSPPAPRKRVGTTFQLPESVLLSVDQLAIQQQQQQLQGKQLFGGGGSVKGRTGPGEGAKGVDRLEEMKSERAILQTEVDMKGQIVEAEKKLLQEGGHKLKRAVRKQRKQQINNMETQLRDMKFRLVQLKRDIDNFSIEADNNNSRHHPNRNNSESYSNQSSLMTSVNRNRAHSVTERLRNQITTNSTDALNTPTPTQQLMHVNGAPNYPYYSYGYDQNKVCFKFANFKSV
ncbi:uncharacterized protein LOC142354268 isoform X2 [Convolutriloba macropyga]|uniref:uncharacterized protein LOC142354268 isoform X2 n=1 Tax=Convolutriloba macropyga TaxID=536237 RepID=UPI003F5240F7